MDLDFCHHSVAYNFKVVSRFLENLHTPYSDNPMQEKKKRKILNFAFRSTSKILSVVEIEILSNKLHMFNVWFLIRACIN